MAKVPRSRITLLGLGILTLLGTSSLSAQGQGTGTVTVDGETQLFIVKQCDWMDHRGTLLLDLHSTAETGSLLFKFQELVVKEGSRGTVTVQGEVVEIAAFQKIHLRPSGHVFEARRRQAADGTWYVDPQGDPAPGQLYQRDSSTVTAGVTFRRNTGETWVVEFRVEGLSCLLKEPCVYPNRC